MAKSIYDNFAIDYVTKRIYHNPADPSASDDVYSVNQLYSWLQDVFDDLDQMDDYVPMTAQTPTAYTLVNGWFIDDASTNYLNGGAITQSNQNSDIVMLELDPDSNWSPFDDFDIADNFSGSESGVRGPLLAYNNTTSKVWIRTDGTFSVADELQGGSNASGGGNVDTVNAGTDLFTNVYTLGTLATLPEPQVYIFQSGEALAEWSSLSNWDRGHIDILVKVRESGTLIDSGNITVFARQLGDLYDNFEIDLSAGGRNAVPLATSTDLDNATASHYLLVTSPSGTFTTGEIVTGATSEATAQLVAYASTGANALLSLAGIKGTFSDAETVDGGTSLKSATVNGTVGDTYFAYAGTDPDEVGSAISQATSTAARIIRAYDATDNTIVSQVDSSLTGASRNVQYIGFDATNLVTGSGSISVTPSAISTTVVSGYSDITITFVNGTATYSGSTASDFIINERVTWGTGGEGIILDDSNAGAGAARSGTVTIGNFVVGSTDLSGTTITGDISSATVDCTQDLQSAHTVDKAFSGVATEYPYDIIVEGGDIYRATSYGRNVADIYEYFKYVTTEDSTFQMYTVVAGSIVPLDGEEYIQAYNGYAPVKASPIGTFAGGTLFGARGVFVEGMHEDDTQAFILLDSDNVVRNPPTYAVILVNSINDDDRVSVFERIGSNLTDDPYRPDKGQYTLTTQSAGAATIIIGEAIPSSTPTAGFIRTVNTITQDEQRYQYASWSGSTFTLHSNTPLTLVDQGTTDTAYVPYIDDIFILGSSTNASVTVIHSINIDLLIRVRQAGYLPFQANGTFTSAGSTTGAIRTDDSIAVV